MNPPDKLLPLSPQDQRIADEQKEHQVGHGIKLMFAGIVGFSAAGNVAPKTVLRYSDLLWGFRIRPLSSPGPIAKITGSSWTWALPPPLGIMPPEYYGASPTYLGDAFPILPKSKLLATATTPERDRVYKAEKQREQLENEVLGFLSTFGRDPLAKQHAEISELPDRYRVEGTTLEFQVKIIERELDFHKLPFTPIRFITEAQYAALPQIQPAAVLDEFPGAGTPVVPVPVAVPQPNAAPVQQVDFGINVPTPVTLIALGIEQFARGIAKELVTEKNDP